MAKLRKKRPAEAPAVAANPFTERGFIVSGALLGIGVLCGTLAVLTTAADGSDDDTGSAPVGPAVSALQLPPLENCPARPMPSPGAGAADSDSPQNATWTSYRGVFVPVSNASGPLAAQGDVARCFSHSQTGALIAAVHITSRYAFSPNWREIGQYQIVADPARDAALQRRAYAVRTQSEAGRALPDPQRVRQVTGYQIVSYADEAATVRILTATSSGGPLVSAMYTVVWVDGDWKLQMQATGSTSVSVEAVDSPAGYTTWGDSAGRQ